MLDFRQRAIVFDYYAPGWEQILQGPSLSYFVNMKRQQAPLCKALMLERARDLLRWACGSVVLKAFYTFRRAFLRRVLCADFPWPFGIDSLCMVSGEHLADCKKERVHFDFQHSLAVYTSRRLSSQGYGSSWLTGEWLEAGYVAVALK